MGENCLHMAKNELSYVRQTGVFSLNLFNLYSRAITTEIEVLPAFSISGHNLNIRYADDTMLMADTKRKLPKLFKSR